MKRAYCLAGLPASGKTTVGAILERMGHDVFYMGHIVEEQAKQRYGENVSVEDIARVANKLRSTYGEDIVAVNTIELMKDATDTVIIEGVRSTEEYEAFERVFEETHLVVIEASRRTRTDRAREDTREIVSYEELRDLDNRDLKLGLKNLIEEKDVFYTIENDSSYDSLLNEVNSFVEEAENL